MGAAAFDDFFAGPPPEFQVSSVKRKNNVKRSFDDNEHDFEDSPTYSNKTLRNNKGQKISNGN